MYELMHNEEAEEKTNEKGPKNRQHMTKNNVFQISKKESICSEFLNRHEKLDVCKDVERICGYGKC